MKRLMCGMVMVALLCLAGACVGAEGTATVRPTADVVETGTAVPTRVERTPTLLPTAVETPSTPTQDQPGGPRATALALGAAVTLVPAEIHTAIRSDDYPALFEYAWQIVQENYVRDDFNGIDWEAVREAYRPQVKAVDNQDEFWDLLAALISELGDDHSRFVRPDAFAAEFDLPRPDDFTAQLGPGFILWPAPEDEQLLLWQVCELGAAARAGLRRGDAILAINGQTFEQSTDWPKVWEVLYERSDSVTLTVQRGPESEPEKIELDFASAAGCDGWYYGLLTETPAIGYLRVPAFSGDADVNILKAIERMEGEGPLAGLILDVRHNPGGNAQRSIAVFTQGTFGWVGPLREDATQTIYRVRGPVRWNETTPVAVLMDGNSHSAAEYFATAMQQSGRATLVGMPTAGNTEGITGFSLPDGALIRLAVSTLQLPDGSVLEGTGVTPDVRVPLGKWGLRADPDLQLDAAYDVLAGE